MKRFFTLAGTAMVVYFTTVPPAAAQEYSVPASPDALVVFLPMRGDVSVVGWDRDSVRIAVEEAGPVRVEIESVTGGIQVLERRGVADAAAKPTYRLSVPRNATVRVSSQGGTITLRNLRGVVRARIVDGSIRADSISGHVELSTVTGSLELSDSRGVLEVRSVNGDLTLSRVSGAIRTRTTSGAVRIDLRERSTVVAESYSGGVTFSGPLGGGPSSFATHSGEIQLELPGDGGVTLLVTQVQSSGLIDCGSARELPAYGQPMSIGSGGDPVDVVTFSGTVEVRCTR